MIRALIALCALSVAYAQLLFPNQIPFQQTHERPLRVAVIGAGPAGSSAAYFLNHFRRHAGTKTDVTVYESNSYIGGRATVVKPWLDHPAVWGSGKGDDDGEDPVELGASIFIAANENMMKASRVFNLTLKSNDGEQGGMSVWDGEQFVWVESNGWGYWDLAKMFWRYGRSPLTVRNLVKATVATFTTLYSDDFVKLGPWDSIYDYAAALNLTAPASTTASGLFHEQRVSSLFTNELIAAATTVNYGQRARDIHGVGALVSLAPNGASTVVGGNRQIFERFVADSDARVHLDDPVISVTKLDAAKYDENPQWVVQSASGGGTYDAVILAAPLHKSGIRFLNTRAAERVYDQPYVKLQVTFVITNATRPSGPYFGQKEGTLIPSSAVFATHDTSSKTKPSFNSLNYVKPLSDAVGARYGQGTMHVVKMFSNATLSPCELEAIFGLNNVRKTYEKVWDAYPQLEPIASKDDLSPAVLDRGLYYVNSFERLISTMETELVGSFNVVSLLLRDFFAYVPPRSWARW